MQKAVKGGLGRCRPPRLRLRAIILGYLFFIGKTSWVAARPAADARYGGPPPRLSSICFFKDVSSFGGTYLGYDIYMYSRTHKVVFLEAE